MLSLETERLNFRQWNQSDHEALSQFYAKEENAKFVGGVKNLEETWRLLANYIGQYVLKGYSYLAIDEKSSGNFVGAVGLYDSPSWPEPELGYWLIPEAQGKGYGVEAGLVVKNFALNTLNLDSLVSYIDPANEPSKKLALRLGAKFDSVIPLLDFGPHEVYRYW